MGRYVLTEVHTHNPAKSRAETRKGKQSALVAGHQIIGLARFGQSQEKIIGGIGRASDARQHVPALGKVLELVHEAASRVGLDAVRDCGLAPLMFQRTASSI